MRFLLTLLLVLAFTRPAPAITPAEYTALIRTASEQASPAQLRTAKACQAKSAAVSRYTVFYALGEAFLARQTGEPARAERAWQVLQAVNQCMAHGEAKARDAQCGQMEAAWGSLWRSWTGWMRRDGSTRNNAANLGHHRGLRRRAAAGRRGAGGNEPGGDGRQRSCGRLAAVSQGGRRRPLEGLC